MFWYVVYYHCSEFQIFNSLNGLHFSVLSLYPNYVQNLAWFTLHYIFLTTANQSILTSFSNTLYPCHWSLPGKNWPIPGFSPLFHWTPQLNSCFCHLEKGRHLTVDLVVFCLFCECLWHQLILARCSKDTLYRFNSHTAKLETFWHGYQDKNYTCIIFLKSKNLWYKVYCFNVGLRDK